MNCMNDYLTCVSCRSGFFLQPDNTCAASCASGLAPDAQGSCSPVAREKHPVIVIGGAIFVVVFLIFTAVCIQRRSHMQQNIELVAAVNSCAPPARISPQPAARPRTCAHKSPTSCTRVSTARCVVGPCVVLAGLTCSAGDGAGLCHRVPRPGDPRPARRGWLRRRLSCASAIWAGSCSEDHQRPAGSV
jgi:hypothetical protein